MSREDREIRHLLIIRLSAMGDAAMTVPVVSGLRAARPDLRISILTRTPFRAFFRDIPRIEFIDFDPRGKHRGMRGLARLAGEIRKAGVDAVADMHDVLRTKVLRRLLWSRNVQTAVIDKGRQEKRLLTRRFRKFRHPLTPTVERYRLTLLQLGLYCELARVPGKKAGAVPAALKDRAGEKTGIWVGVAPFAAHKGKIYPIPLADRLIALLAARYQKIFMFGGGRYEQDFAEEVERLHPGVVSVIGKTDLSGEMDLMSIIDVMVTMDSSSMHIASLTGTPVVSVWGATHPWAGFYGYGQDERNAVQLELPCRPCSVYGDKECIHHNYRCMSDISPETIADRVAEALERGKR